MAFKIKKKRKMSKEELAFHLVAYPLLTLAFLICAYPFWYLFICTISENRMVDLGQITLIPKGIHLDNYIRVLKTDNLGNAAIVTIIRVIMGTGLQMLVSSYAAYFFTRQEMWHRKFWYRMVVATMYFTAGMIPVYLNIKMLGLLNTFWVYVIPGMVSVYNMILIKTSIEALPPDLEESAYLDGAGYLARFFRIVLPLQKPILATVGLFGVVHHWNDFFTTKLYVTRPKLFTLQFMLYELLNQVRSVMEQPSDFGAGYDNLTPMATRMTMTAIVVIPIMLVYPFIQKYYVKGIMIGAVKG